MIEPDRKKPKRVRTMKPGPRYEVGRPALQFDCKWAVYTRNGDTSVCYCTDRDRAQLITDALNAYPPNAPRLPDERSEDRQDADVGGLNQEGSHV